jgi:LacI family transcriptional regulator
LDGPLNDARYKFWQIINPSREVMTKPMKKRPSMKDVAKLAGVSQTTVSFVINETDAGIPDETKERVWKAVRELGYRPNILARGLRSNRTYTIGFISDEIATTPFAVQIIHGAQDLAWENGYIILMINTGGDQEMKEAAINTMYDRKVDGIIYATMYHREVHPPEIKHEIPIVLLDCFVEDSSLPSVVPDEVAGGRTATGYLLEKGHRRIGLINPIKPIPAKHGRLEGYKTALSNFNIPYDEKLVCEVIDGIPEGGYAGTMQLMKLKDPPTALFCFNDRMAMGAYDALRKLGKSIPNDIAVIGFDNQELIAADLYPGLTTMALPHYQMGQWAVNRLLEYIEEPDKWNVKDFIQGKLECPLIIRDSV